MANTKFLSENLKKYRQIRGLSQAGLGELLFVSPQSVSKWETGASVPDISNLCALANALGISCDKLLEEETESRTVYFVGIDGGGTKTEAVLFGVDGKIVSRKLREGCNPNVIGMGKCCEILGSIVDEMKSFGVKICGLFAGIAGSGVGDNARIITDYLKSNHCTYPVTVCSDAVNVISSIRGCREGISVIWGTGFTVTVHNNGSLRRFAGWGYLFDEEASGYAIGRAVLMHCLRCHDMTEERCLLTEMAEEKLGGEINDRLSHIYSMGKDYIASFARTAFDAYYKGDKVAESIIRKSIICLADTVNHALKVQNCEKNIVISGGLTVNEKILKNILKERLAPDVRVMIPKLPQVYGACLSCLNKYGMSECATEEFEENFTKDYCKE